MTPSLFDADDAARERRDEERADLEWEDDEMPPAPFGRVACLESEEDADDAARERRDEERADLEWEDDEMPPAPFGRA